MPAAVRHGTVSAYDGWHNAPVSISAEGSPKARIVTALLRGRQSGFWLIEAWTGAPVNAAPDEHDAIAWFTEDALGELSLTHDSYLAMFSKVLAEHRA
jgi:hypothetical protein